MKPRPSMDAGGRPSEGLRRRWAWGVVALAVALGMLLAMHGGSPSEKRDLQALSVNELAAMVESLSQETAVLREEAAALAIQVAERQSQFSSEAILTSREEEDLEALELLTGLREGKGPGVVLEIADPLGALAPFDCEQLIGELRSSGAEAIVLNGIRLEFNAHFGGVPPRLTVGGQEVHHPYIVQAIGPTDVLALSLELPGGLLSRLRALPGVKAPLYLEDVIIVPPRSRVGAVFEHATRAAD